MVYFPADSRIGTESDGGEYAISSLEEARAYLGHPVLGPRLEECTRLVNAVEGRSIDGVLGEPDDLKFRSCMTLFAQAAEEKKVFLEALQKYFGGELDPLTMNRLGQR